MLYYPVLTRFITIASVAAFQYAILLLVGVAPLAAPVNVPDVLEYVVTTPPPNSTLDIPLELVFETGVVDDA